MLSVGLAQAQVSGYSFTQSNGSYAPLTGATVVATASAGNGYLDSSTIPVTLPFSFVFNGASYGSLFINSNGSLTFGSASTTTVPISSTTSYSGAISALGRDLQGRQTAPLGEISTQTLGSGSAQTFVVQFSNFQRFGNSSPGPANDSFSFQIRLNQLGNTIDLVYGPFTYDGSGSTNAQVGLRGANSNDFNNRTILSSGSWAASSAGTNSSASMALSATVIPAAGLTFTFTPPACSMPSISVGSVSTSSASVSFSVVSGDSYTISTTPASSTQTVTTSPATLSGLMPGTSYTVQVVRNCAGGASSAPATATFTTAYAAPANDDCSGAIGLTPQASCTPVSGTTIGATASAVPNACDGSADDDVWYSFVATTGQHIINVTGNSGFDAVLSLRSGACPGTALGTCTDATGSGGTETITASGLTVGATYYVRVFTYSSAAPTTAAAGGFTICVVEPPACAAPSSVAASNITSTSANITFTVGNGNTSYSVTATPTSGSAVTATGTSSPIALTGLASGMSYSVVVTGSCSGGATASSTAYTFSTLTPPPANDNCANAITLTSAASCSPVAGTVAGATQSLPRISCNGFGGSGPAQDVWYRFTASVRSHTIAITGTFDGVLEVRSDDCAAGTNVGCSDVTGNNETLTLTTFNPGTTYLLRYYPSVANPVDKTFSICITQPADLTVSSPQNVPPGSYNNITVQGGGVATLTGPTSVFGTLLVQSGGSLAPNCQTLSGPGSFTLAAGAELRICSAAGITATATVGDVQMTGTRSYSPDASYLYMGSVAQSTGNGLPATVRSLMTSNANNLTLSQPVAVTQEVRLLAAGNIVTTASNTLTLLSTPGGTALVANLSTGAVTGPGAIMQRAIDPGLNAGPGYRHYSSPVQSTTLADLSTPGFTPVVNPAYNSSATPNLITPFPTVFGYDETRIASVTSTYSSFDKGWFSPSALTDVMQPTQGYTVNIPASAIVDFRGTFNNGTVSTGPLTRGTDPQAGWHLVGNPYPSPLNWSDVAAADRSGLDAAMYVFESTSQYGGQYRSYVNGMGSGNPLVAAGQGFFVRVSAGQASGQLTFRNSQRSTDFAQPAPFRRGQADLRPQLQLQVQAPTGLVDAVYLYAQAGATAGTDAGFDAAKLVNPSGLNLAAVAADGQAQAVAGLPGFSSATLVPLALAVPAAGSYVLRLAELGNWPAGQAVYLHDAQTGQQVELRQQAGYRVSLSAQQAAQPLAGRFSLRFGPAAPLATSAPLAAAVHLYPNPARERCTVEVPGVAGARQVQATLVNSLGQQVRTHTAPLPAGGTQLQLDLQGLAQGVYTLQLRIGAEVLTRRLAVQ
ncbi:hypothetical protein GCM10023185_11560 [Hymenobacter saemangeumensis]|uniref:Fibronectin type-III domain-containing protein n=1 Tax=Hymenobacter saemangeumensis TaxID=1084522 RepID=A0ABP8I6K2_9BACT